MDPYNLLNNFLILGALLFTLGLVGFLTRRNLIVMFLCAELMLQGVSLTLVGFSTFHHTWAGQVFTIFSLALAGGEAAIALALIVVLFRRNRSLDISLWQDLREPDQPPIVDEFAKEPEPAERQWPQLPQAGRLPGKRAAKPGDPIPGMDPLPGEHPGVKHREPAEVPHA
jgi:NADH-quinone oxidoreductase subunit K